jgi:hypothetical protein
MQMRVSGYTSTSSRKANCFASAGSPFSKRTASGISRSGRSSSFARRSSGGRPWAASSVRVQLGEQFRRHLARLHGLGYALAQPLLGAH